MVAVAVFATAYTALTVYDHYFKWGRMWQTPAVRPYEDPILIMDKDVVPIHGGEALYRNTDPNALHSPFSSPTAKVIEAGRTLYATYCQQCHGVNHDGQGTVGQSFAPLPADLRTPKVQQTWEGLMFKEISYGVPEGRQPALATTIAPRDRWRIIAYLKSLGVRESMGKSIAKK